MTRHEMLLERLYLGLLLGGPLLLVYEFLMY